MVLDGAPAFPKVFSPFVSHCAPACFLLLVGVSAFPAPCLHLSHCTPSCFPVLDGVSAFPGVLSPFVSHCPLYSFVGWRVRLSEDLVSPCIRSVPLLVSLCWIVCPPSRGFCLRLSPIVPLLVSLCWMVCPRFRGSCLALSAMAPLLVSLCWMARVRLSQGLVSACIPVTQCTPSCCPLLGGVSGLPLIVSPCFPLLDTT